MVTKMLDKDNITTDDGPPFFGRLGKYSDAEPIDLDSDKYTDAQRFAWLMGIWSDEW